MQETITIHETPYERLELIPKYPIYYAGSGYISENSFSSFPVVVTLVSPLEKLTSAFLMLPEDVHENVHLDFHSSGGKYTLSYNP